MKCKYCHLPAGLFRRSHKECRDKHEAALLEIDKTVKTCLAARQYNLMESLTPIAERGYVMSAEIEEVLYINAKNLLKYVDNDYTEIKDYINALPVSVAARVKRLPDYVTFWRNVIERNLMEILSEDPIISSKIDDIRSMAQEVGYDAVDDFIKKDISRRIDDFIDDGFVDERKEEYISRYMDSTGLTSAALNNNESYKRFVQSLVLMDVQNKGRSERVKVDSVPVLMTKKESLLWIYQNVCGYEEKTGRRMQGGSRGVNIRLCKGVYYRVGNSRGHSVEYQYSASMGMGVVIITTRAIYFVSESCTMKILIPKIISMEPYSDGIKLYRDGVRSHPVTFVGLDPWFIMNLLPMLNE